jgi:hypothetical protein
MVALICARCKTPFERERRQVHMDAEKAYCSRACNASANLRARPGPVKSIVHGTAQGYQHYKCRCEECRDANRRKQERYRYGKLQRARMGQADA